MVCYVNNSEQFYVYAERMAEEQGMGEPRSS
jgi:hypothetical protein